MRHLRPLVAIALVAIALVLALAGCRDDGDPRPRPGEEQDPAGDLVVLAATSLAGAFDDVAAAFEAAHPRVDVHVSTDGSANLATAIVEGVPADVFASADEANLEKVADEGLLAGGPAVFATNRLQIVVAEGNPLGIAGLADLVEPGVVVSLCQPEVPCGAYARRAFEAAGVRVPAAGEEDKVSGVLTKVALGEADAGLVYATDVLAAEGVEGVDLAHGGGVVVRYPVAVLRDAENPAAAAAFVAFLQAEGQEFLVDHGFGVS